ncbi:AAA family ATPase [Spongiactinospora sp. TRM90649]|uniref:HelD family protein n=1 Tax=Spongiactinospora sp. TRM90649 TaxID=3031114 RepID=UPI0023F9CBA8|nr:AAA family ATPase [Spongiactinospora sp. TRM90649]MDF5757367.1 AAA family ATPase [Spongiactinospora sp. TRM90649]
MPQFDEGAAGQVEVEQAHVAAMYGLLDERLADARAQLADVLRSSADSAGEAYTRDVEAERLARRIRRLEGAEDGLAFGRIDGADGTVLHIGRLGLRTGDRDLPLLVDWRAEAARSFYAATAVHPMGLRRRRHLQVKDRVVRTMSDELLDGSAPAAGDIVGDGPLTEALEAHRTGRMRAAVATLQAEQDGIVRSPHRGVMVVQGGPGTGKTVVALHRAAYVLYAFPGAAARGVLLLGPNTRFLDYVSQVLPSLGENDVLLATCAELAGVVPTAVEPFDVARLKGGSALAEALADLVRSLQAPGGGFAVRVGQEWVRLKRADVAAAREAAVASGLAHNRAREVFKEHLIGMVAGALERGTVEALEHIDAEISESTGMDLDAAVEADLRSLGFDDAPAADPAEVFDADAVRAYLVGDAHVDSAVESLWPRLVPEVVVGALLADTRTMARHLPSLAGDEHSRLVRSSDAPWTDADVPLLDEAAALVDGPPERTFGHVVVDEAQELTAMQWRMVMRRCPARSMTLVGDFAQAGPATTAGDWSQALGPHLGGRFALHTLTVSYRTTQEILATTHDLLTRIAPGQTPSRSIRHGEPPRSLTACPHTLATMVAKELRAQSAAHPGELLAVICADDRVKEMASAGVAQWARLVPASEARGLEFDAIVIVSPEEIVAARPSGERDLYVALTRATKRVCTIAVHAAGRCCRPIILVPQSRGEPRGQGGHVRLGVGGRLRRGRE